MGTVIDFNADGSIRSDSSHQAARKQGTTVTVAGLFGLLPVRRKELQKNIKREFHKLVLCLQAYALAHPNVRFSLSNQMDKKCVRTPSFQAQ